MISKPCHSWYLTNKFIFRSTNTRVVKKKKNLCGFCFFLKKLLPRELCFCSSHESKSCLQPWFSIIVGTKSHKIILQANMPYYSHQKINKFGSKEKYPKSMHKTKNVKKKKQKYSPPYNLNTRIFCSYKHHS